MYNNFLHIILRCFGDPVSLGTVSYRKLVTFPNFYSSILREGLGRTARLFSNLLAIKHGFERFPFDLIKQTRLDEYIKAVQAAADKNYAPMKELFKDLKTV